ncbi:S4 domain-containing protein [Chitinibacter sp. GC72]|uniref:S4 domain-containing protein n=1 Tax=Chitinibacter sp. GC72 TaxID=1526917 RepID=UPI0012FA3012|nr:RNA pseudouridine synthase [Chitinibacter sp. GC72]
MSQDNPDAIRLSKRMAELGLCSRTQADVLIAEGRVQVDGQIVDVLGSRVLPHQDIKIVDSDLLSSALAPRDKVTLIWHKPVGVSVWPGEEYTQFFVPENRAADDRSGIVWLKKHRSRLTTPFGLDAEASGLVLLTQDVRLAAKLAQINDFEQEYLVWLDQAATDSQIEAMNAVRMFDEQPIKGWKTSRQSEQQLRMVIRANAEGVVPDLCDVAKLTVKAFKRNRIGRLPLGGLEAGQWRYLLPMEKI